MPVSFSQIPSTVLLPLFYAEVTQTQEPISPNLRLCLVGMANKDSVDGAGTGTLNMPYLLSGTYVKELFGAGSMMERMYQQARSNAPFAEIWGVAVPEATTGIRAVGSLTVVKAGSTTLYGTSQIYIGGRLIRWNVGQTSTTTQIAAAISSAVNAARCHVRASYAGAVVTLTCRWGGYTGNQIAISTTSCHGRADLTNKAGSLTRSMVSVKGMGQITSGQGENDPRAAFSVLNERPFDVFVWGGGVSSSITSAITTFMDHVAGRWSPKLQKYGHFVSCLKTSDWQYHYDYLVKYNDPHQSIMCVKASILSPWDFSSALAGQMVTHWAAPPELSRPLQTLELRNICVGSEDDESFTRPERQTLLEQGGSTFQVGDDYICRIDRVRTLRKTNVYGDPDPSWADAILMFQSQFFVRQMRAAIQGAYPRSALSGSPTGINGFTSAIEIKNVVMHEYKRMQALGLVENFDLFSAYLVCERNEVDRNRVDILMRPDFINQLRVVAALVETHLELDATDPTLIAA